jgi:hypothetical protein
LSTGVERALAKEVRIRKGRRHQHEADATDDVAGDDAALTQPYRWGCVAGTSASRVESSGHRSRKRG